MREELEQAGSRRGIGLCLSGGGFRATLFHLGGLRRLNEVGLLARPDFRTVAAVSGGSIAAAALASAYARTGGTRLLSREGWEREVSQPLRRLTRMDLRTGPFLKRLWPWNVWRSETTVEALAERYQKELTDLPLVALPEQPDFLFLATDMAWGVSWLFSRGRMGDYQAGYMTPPDDFTVARAVAASACFPPFMDPMRLRLDPMALKGGSAPRGAARDACLRDFRLTDGGNYDNMGLEPVWKGHSVVLVSDAGGLFTNASDRGLLWRIPRYAAIQERQARSLRKRWLIASFQQGVLEGTYWGVGSAVSRYRLGDPGYSADLTRQVIAEIRTDLDACTDAEAAVLENHGYLLVEAALRQHVPALLPDGCPAAEVPHPEWFPPACSEEAIRAALADSSRTRVWGRG